MANNINVQSAAPAANIGNQSQINTAARQTRSVSTPRPLVQSGQAPSLAQLMPSLNILSAHTNINSRAVIPLVSSDFPMSFSDREIPESSISRYVGSVNEALAPSFFRLEIGIHEPTNNVMVQVVDTRTAEVLRELPPESRLDIMAKLREFAGLLFDRSG